MARKKLVRRFDPLGGVNQSMVDAESRYVARELEDYLLLSIRDLSAMLGDQQRKIGERQSHLQRLIGNLADRERLALRCMIARDVFHIASLYVTFMQSTDAPQTTGASRPQPEELNDDDETRPMLPFSEWLFEQ